MVRRQYEDFRERVPLKGKRVVLKPNLVEYHRDKVINTHPHVVAAVIELCRREGAAEVIVAEGPGHWRNVEYLVAASGLGDVLRHYKVPFIDLNHDEPVKTVNLGRLTEAGAPVPVADHRDRRCGDFAAEAEDASLGGGDAVAEEPVRHAAGHLLRLAEERAALARHRQQHRGHRLTRTPDLAIVDGIVGMEGDGPLNGTPKPMGLIVMGCDLVAVDATCCRLMQLDPEMVPYLVMGSRKKLGRLAEKQIQQVGETIAGRAQPFDTVPHFQPLWTGRCEAATVGARNTASL